MNRYEGAPREQLKALFEAIIEKTTKPSYRGCLFINTVMECSEPDHPGREVALAHKRELRARLLKLSKDLGASDPVVLADQLLLLLDGAYSTAGTLGGTPPNLTFALLKAAEVLLAAQLSTPP